MRAVSGVDGEHGRSKRPWVTPLATARDFEPLDVDDLVELLFRRGHRVVTLVGAPGSGRTTALRYVAAQLPEVRVADTSEPPDPDAEQVLVAADAVSRRAARADVVARLLPWGLDQALEYLARRHPKRCGDVLRRLRSAGDRDLLGGSAELWRAAIVALLRDPEVACVADALRHALRGRGAEHLLRHEGARAVRTADEVLADPRRFADVLPFETVRELARHAAARAEARRLAAISGGAEEAMASSVLLAADPEWRPSDGEGHALGSGHFRGARWAGAVLTRATLGGADLEGADLADATLNHARAGRAVLRRAVLRGASLLHAHLSGADLTGADLAAADLRGAVLEGACLRAAQAAECRLDAANLALADLRGADLRGASLLNATLSKARLEGADLRGVAARTARLPDVDLSGARLDGATFERAWMLRSRLAGVSWEDARLSGAFLQQADLTSSRMPRAHLDRASLPGARLADVSWPGADLRGALLRDVQFHFGSSRSGRLDSVIASEGTRTGFYTSEANELHYQQPEVIRTADLTEADLRGADVTESDFYLVDLRGALYDEEQGRHFRRCGAIVSET